MHVAVASSGKSVLTTKTKTYDVQIDTIIDESRFYYNQIITKNGIKI